MIDPVEFGKAMGAIVRDATAPLIARIEQLEKALAGQSIPSAEELIAKIDLDALAKSAADLVPAPEKGADADMDALRAHLDDLVAELPVPQDGKSISVDDLRPVIEEAVNGLREEATKALEDPLAKAEEAREALLQALGDLKQPADGKSVTVEDVAPLIRDEVAKAIAEVPPAKDGVSVSAEDVRPMLVELVDSAVKALPPAENGQDADMSALKEHLGELVKGIQLPDVPTAEEVGALFERRFSDLTLHWERQVREDTSKALDRIPAPKDGRDALPLESFDLELGEDGRTVTVKMQAGEALVEKSVRIASVIDRGVFTAEKAYEQGDGTTYGGCYWIAQKDAPQGVPGCSNDWRLAVKKGRDGKDLRDSASKHDPSKGVKVV